MLRNYNLPVFEGEHAARRSLLPTPQDTGWQVTLVDACCYGREGLRTALKQYSRSGRRAMTVSLTLALPHLAIIPGEKMATTARRCLAIRLPPTAREALHLLLQLALLPAGYYARVVVLSAVEPAVIRRVLSGVGLRSPVCLADDRLALAALCRIVLPLQGERIRARNCPDEVLPYTPRSQLTPAEYRVLTWTLLGMSVLEQAYQTGTMVKTIYTQRAAALRKLKVRDIRTLLRQFSPAARRTLYI